MRSTFLALVVLSTTAASAAALEVEHVPVACAALDRYLVVSARGVPAEGVAAGEVAFRTGEGAGWYTVAMSARDGAWTAALPRPVAPLARFEYRVTLKGRDA